MDWQAASKPDLPHRLLQWAEANKRHLVLTLLIAILFFGGLASLSLWRGRGEREAQEAYYKLLKEKGNFETILRRYPKSSASLLALTELANQAKISQSYPDCIQRYETLYEKAGRRVFYRVLALHGIGECCRLQGDFAKAASYFERASQEPGNIQPMIGRFEQALTLQLGHDPQAKTIFEELYQREDLSSELKNKVEEQLLWYSLQEKS